MSFKINNTIVNKDTITPQDQKPLFNLNKLQSTNLDEQLSLTSEDSYLYYDGTKWISKNFIPFGEEGSTGPTGYTQIGSEGAAGIVVSGYIGKTGDFGYTGVEIIGFRGEMGHTGIVGEMHYHLQIQVQLVI